MSSGIKAMIRVAATALALCWTAALSWAQPAMAVRFYQTAVAAWCSHQSERAAGA